MYLTSVYTHVSTFQTDTEYFHPPESSLKPLQPPGKNYSSTGIGVGSRLPGKGVFEVGETFLGLESVGTKASGGGRGDLDVAVVQGHMVECVLGP